MRRPTQSQVKKLGVSLVVVSVLIGTTLILAVVLSKKADEDEAEGEII